jgi:hypothetical protein
MTNALNDLFDFGCNRGSPPLIVTIAVFNRASWSMRRSIVSVGIGGEKSSYSLQYPQEDCIYEWG